MKRQGKMAASGEGWMDAPLAPPTGGSVLPPNPKAGVLKFFLFNSFTYSRVARRK
jgi:hypothetical protein